GPTTPASARRVRTDLGTPHGRRFSPAPAPPPARRLTEAERLAREKALLEQMRDNPWVARRIREGELPAWIRATPTRVEFPEVPARSEERRVGKAWRARRARWRSSQR